MFQIRSESAEHVTKELDLLAYGAVALVVNRFKCHRPEVVSTCSLRSCSKLTKVVLLTPISSAMLLSGSPRSPQLYKTRFRIVILHNANFVAQNDIIADVKL